MAAKKNHKKQTEKQTVASNKVNVGKRIMALILCILLALGVVALPLASVFA